MSKKKAKKLDLRVEPLLPLILEARRARARIELEGVIEVEMAPAPEPAVIRRLVRVLQWFFGS